MTTILYGGGGGGDKSSIAMTGGLSVEAIDKRKRTGKDEYAINKMDELNIFHNLVVPFGLIYDKRNEQTQPEMNERKEIDDDNFIDDEKYQILFDLVEVKNVKEKKENKPYDRNIHTKKAVKRSKGKEENEKENKNTEIVYKKPKKTRKHKRNKSAK
jgi:hypothetical protein